MEKIIKLASVLLKENGMTGSRTTDPKNRSVILKRVLLAGCAMFLFAFLLYVGMEAKTFFHALKGEELLLRGVFFLAGIIFCVTGFSPCMNTFYLSSSLEDLLVLPFTPAQITGAKFLVIYLQEIYISMVTLLPFLVGFGISDRGAVTYWIGAAAAVILIPVVSLSFAGIVVMVMMRFASSFKDREHMVAVGVFATVIGTMVYSYVVTSVQNMKTAVLGKTIAHMVGRFQDITWLFPEIPFLAGGMHQKLWWKLALAFVITVGSYLLFLFASHCLYLEGALRRTQGTGHRKKMDSSHRDKALSYHSQKRGLLLRELQTLFHTPQFYLNCLVMTLGWPIIVVVPMIFQGQHLDFMEELYRTDQKPQSIILLLLLVALLLNGFSTCTNSIGTSSVSREGKDYMILKQLPISNRDYLQAKRRSALIICLIGGCLYSTILMAVLMVMKHMAWWCVPVTAVFSGLIVCIIIDSQMILGLMKVHLEWDSEGTAVKNAGGFVALLMILALSVTGMILVKYVADYIRMNPLVLFLLILCVLILLERILYIILFRYGCHKLEHM